MLLGLVADPDAHQVLGGHLVHRPTGASEDGFPARFFHLSSLCLSANSPGVISVMLSFVSMARSSIARRVEITGTGTTATTSFSEEPYRTPRIRKRITSQRQRTAIPSSKKT